MSSPARIWSETTIACASENCSRYHGSIMAVSRGRPHKFTLYQRGRGHEPVTVAGRIRSLVAVNAMSMSFQTVDIALSRLGAPAFYHVLCRMRIAQLTGDHPPRLQHKPWIGPRAVPARSTQKPARALGASNDREPSELLRAGTVRGQIPRITQPS